MHIHDFFAGDAVDVPALGAWLDDLDPATRVAETTSLSAREQARLFEAAEGHRAITLDDLVPAAAGAGTTVIHHGRNSLPLFKRFQKRFYRPEAGAAELWGYNEGATRPLVGPGYFVVHPVSGVEVLVDYTRLPPKAPEAWPALKSNAAGLSRFVFNGTQDLLRGVSRHVSIGRATRGGATLDNWFVLCREDPAA